jgi:hypothetical protein
VASDRQRNFEFLIVLSIIWKTIKSTVSTTGGNFDELKSGELDDKHAVATWSLGIISAFA